MPDPIYNVLFDIPSQDDKMWQNQDGRVWIKLSAADPYGFLGCAMLAGFTNPGPAVTPVNCPDPQRRRKFVQVDVLEAAPGRGSVNMSMYLTKLNFLRQLQWKGCVYHLDARYGECGEADDPDDWEHILRFCGVRVGDLTSTDLHARDASAEVDITAALNYTSMYDVWPMLAENIATIVPANITAVVFCDSLNCGECGLTPSIGCNIAYAVTVAPVRLMPYFGLTDDGGETWTWRDIDVWDGGEDARDLACVGSRVVVVSEDVGELVYTEDEGVTWNATTLGFLAGCNGRAIFSLDARHTWIAATSGTIYFTADPTSSVVAQTNASLTTNNLNDIIATDTNHVYAVGDNNTFLYSEDAGNTWVAGVGPAAGDDLECIWAINAETGRFLIVGTRGGEVWQTFDGGVTWTQRTLPGMTGTFNIAAIQGCGCSGLEMFLLAEEGTYLAPTEGHLFRTIDGGVTWREIDLPTNLGVEDVACCSPNKALVVGDVLASGFGFVASASG
jgi:photosystem II stability/assembly factor-like uncharacterized protein